MCRDGREGGSGMRVWDGDVGVVDCQAAQLKMVENF